MAKKKLTPPVEEVEPQVEAIVKTTHGLKNPILTEADLQRFASSFASRGFANKKFNSDIVKFSRFYSLNKP
jgi:hypothetical protein